VTASGARGHLVHRQRGRFALLLPDFTHTSLRYLSFCHADQFLSYSLTEIILILWGCRGEPDRLSCSESLLGCCDSSGPASSCPLAVSSQIDGISDADSDAPVVSWGCSSWSSVEAVSRASFSKDARSSVRLQHAESRHQRGRRGERIDWRTAAARNKTLQLTQISGCACDGTSWFGGDLLQCGNQP